MLLKKYNSESRTLVALQTSWTALLWYDFHTIKFIHLMYTIQWLLVNC